MEEISDRLFNDTTGNVESGNDDPSLLTIILDLSLKGWYNIKDLISIQDITKSLLVFLNGHLSLNNSNQVAFIVSSSKGSKFLYPDSTITGTRMAEDTGGQFPGMYRQFKMVDQAVLHQLNKFIEEVMAEEGGRATNTLTGALSMALTYTNRMLTLDQSITTTTASAMTTSTLESTSNNNATSSSSASASTTGMKSRVLIVSANDDDDIKYIPLMNCIFAAQKMKVSIDVAKLGHKNSSYLQQASDATKGVYLHIEDPKGIIQVLATAFFIEPNLRPYIILPTNSNVNYRASCFLTGKSVDLGYVCSVCLCIMSKLPDNGKCPACDSAFDKKIINELIREPQVISKKKRKLDNGNSATPTPS
ncbi:RNA polymerase II transcription factor B subunit 4 [Candida viswanathii]|uniref:General transcription and DNA repair factor IIH subunit TFB4 n=1 Tax=Candida viswanathii TaxID=5486 RepID=A0A367XWD6_9ASCO|nr:RNA polymerase II transcription factor B subunit 4 [Candida viswanathii]